MSVKSPKPGKGFAKDGYVPPRSPAPAPVSSKPKKEGDAATEKK